MNKPAAKSLIAGYLEQLAEKIFDDKISGAYAFRGQADAAWKIESAAFRRLEKSGVGAPDKKRVIAYLERDILEPARMNGYGTQNGQRLSDLELLAELQHHGAATCLIDFTREFLVAMWFACQIHKDKDDKETDGKVFIVNINNPGVFLSLERKDLEHAGGIEPALNFETRERGNMPDIKQNIRHAALMPPEQANTPENTTSIQQTPSYWHWSPHGMNERILRQNSLFVFGDLGMLDAHLVGKIQIPKTDKKNVLEELKALGITGEALFKDIPGFAMSHGHDQPIPPRYESAEDYRQAGDVAYQKNELEKARHFYTKAIDIDPNPDYRKAYSNLVIVNIDMNDWESASAACEKLIGMMPEDFFSHTILGYVKFYQGDLEQAKEYFNKVIKILPDAAKPLFYLGKVLFRLEGAEAAKEKFQEAKEMAKQQGDDAILTQIEQALSKLNDPNDDIWKRL